MGWSWNITAPWTWGRGTALGYTLKRGKQEDVKTLKSLYGVPLPIVWGKRRIAGNIIYLGAVEFASTSTASRTVAPLFPMVVAVCEGEIAGIDRMWYEGKLTNTTGAVYSALLGTRPTQTAWSYLSAGYDLGYPGVAGVAAKVVGNGEAVGLWEVEVKGLQYDTGGTEGDADPSLILAEMLGASYYACNTGWDVVSAVGLDGLAASSYARWVAAMGLWLSTACTEQRPAADYVREILDSTCADALWSEGDLKVVPLGDQEVVGSVTYTPCSSLRYPLTVNDLIRDGESEPVEVERGADSDIFNCVPVAFSDRAATFADKAYDPCMVEDPDPYYSQTNGVKRDSEYAADSVCLRDVATTISKFKARQRLYARNVYRFSLPWWFCRLEPFDLVSLPVAGRTVNVQIMSVQESDDHAKLEIEAIDWVAGTNTVLAHTTQSSDAVNATLIDIQAQMHEKAATTWTSWPLPPANHWGACWHEATRTFVVVASSGSLWANYRGEWTTPATPPSGQRIGVASDGVTLVAVGSSAASTSTDGDTWTATATIPAGNYRHVVSTAVGNFAAVADDTAGYSTDSGATFTESTGWPVAWTAVAGLARSTDTGRLIAVGGADGDEFTYSDDDGATWAAAAALPTPYAGSPAYLGAAYGNGVFVVVGGDSRCAVSSDNGATWAESDTPPSGDWFGVIFTGRIFVTSGADGSNAWVLRTSRDGRSWTPQQATPAGTGEGAGPVAWGPPGGVTFGNKITAWSAPVACY